MCLYYITTNKGKFKRVEDLCRIYSIDVRIIDSSVSGLWQKTSNINLLDLV